MDVVELQNKIVSRPEYIEQLLDTMGFENIQDKYNFQNKCVLHNMGTPYYNQCHCFGFDYISLI